MRKAIAFLVAIIATGVIFYACRKTDIPVSPTDKYSNLPTAVAEAALWYDKQMGMGGWSTPVKKRRVELVYIDNCLLLA
ncbi:MAG: hypothetical protein QM594_00945 [Niabella sp.]